MLTKMFSAIPANSRPIVGSIVALALLGSSVPLESANADGIDVTNCVGSFGSFSCVERWGPAVDPLVRLPPEIRQDAEAAERERKWAARCRPVVKQDQYGVGRYRYAAPGCEFGRYQD
jgi:hypothetical protein